MKVNSINQQNFTGIYKTKADKETVDIFQRDLFHTYTNITHKPVNGLCVRNGRKHDGTEKQCDFYVFTGEDTKMLSTLLMKQGSAFSRFLSSLDLNGVGYIGKCKISLDVAGVYETSSRSIKEQMNNMLKTAETEGRKVITYNDNFDLAAVLSHEILGD